MNIRSKQSVGYRKKKERSEMKTTTTLVYFTKGMVSISAWSLISYLSSASLYLTSQISSAHSAWIFAQPSCRWRAATNVDIWRCSELLNMLAESQLRLCSHFPVFLSSAHAHGLLCLQELQVPRPQILLFRIHWSTYLKRCFETIVATQV